MPPRPWTDAETAQMVALHAEGLSLHAIAQRMRRSKGTISTRSAEAGLSFDRSHTAAAAQAKAIDAKDRRAALQVALLDDAEKLRAELWQPHEYVDHGGRDFREVKWTMNTPSIQDKLKLMQAVGVAVDRSLKLADHDSEGSEAVRSLLVGIADSLGLTPDDA